ncbi:MAG: alpha/beta hydrolase [Deltaproteobacteria bacterium]|nr:alpha/beta hydrolase [Deltaproteobacteria bacterium]
MPTCTINGVELTYKLAGPPEADVLVMLHGWTANHTLFEFEGFDEALARELRVLTYDQRGHGDSGKPEDGYGLEEFTTDLKGLLENLAVRRKAIVLGQSMGGYIAAGFAARYPEATKGLILMNTTLNLVDSEEAAQGWQAVIEGQKVDREGTMKQVIRGMFRNPPDPALVDAQYAMSAKTPLPIAIRVFESLFTPGLRDEFRRIAVPTLIIHGEHDVIPLHQAEATHRVIPGSKLVVMEECGHLPSLEMPERTQRLVLDFAASL